MPKPPTNPKDANKMQLQELQHCRARAVAAEQNALALRGQLNDLKRVTPVDAVTTQLIRDSMVALLAAAENIYLDKDGKFVPECPKDLKLALMNARRAIKPPTAVKVEAAATAPAAA